MPPPFGNADVLDHDRQTGMGHEAERYRRRLHRAELRHHQHSALIFVDLELPALKKTAA